MPTSPRYPSRVEQPLLKDQKWYVRMPGRSEVQEAVIRELTANTVLLEITGSSAELSKFGFDVPPDVKRFVTAEVRWIEQL